MALIENIQREDLNAIEEAQALEQLQGEFSLTHQQVADAVGKSRASVSNLLRLNQLSLPVKKMVEQRLIEMGHARALLAITDDENQLEAAQIVTNKMLTVRDTEKLVKKLLNPAVESAVKVPDPKVVDLERRLSEQLGANVALNQQKSGRGKLVIAYDEPHKLAQILAMFGHEV